jgi:EAL domain-containing protein (putative c-di-GMP-specific phosphodiesterase class I)
MHDVKASAKVLEQLSDMGVTISIDDFGTGYSSFAYLAQFPVHALKIDRSFVSELGTSETSRKIVKGMIRLAHSLSIEVIAEGAETEEQLDWLRKMKCDAVQGYVLSQPISPADFAKFAAQTTSVRKPNAMTI